MITKMTTTEKPWQFTNGKFTPSIKEATEHWPVPSVAESARKDNISLLYHFDREDTKVGGYTIAYRPSQGYVGRNHGKMVDVAVAYCSEGDTFSKAIGRKNAIANFRRGNFIQVPALMYGDDALHTCLREMFTWDF